MRSLWIVPLWLGLVLAGGCSVSCPRSGPPAPDSSDDGRPRPAAPDPPEVVVTPAAAAPLGGSGSSDGGVAAVARDAEPARAEESGAASDLDEPHAIPPPLTPHRVRDPELRAVRAGIARRLAALRRSAPGIHPVPELDGRRLGRSYTQLQARLGAGAVAERLETLAYAHARPSPDDPVFYVRQGGGPVRTAAELAGAFELASELPPAEAAASQALVATLEAQLAAHPTLRAYSLQAGWGDAVGAGYHGVAIVPPSGDEVLWIFTEEIWFEG